MRFSSSTRYALQGLAHLARQPSNEFCLAHLPAHHHQLPKDFLAKIFQRLAHKGLLHSKRGPGGGYALAKPPEAISLKEVLECLHESSESPRPCALAEHPCNALKPCILHQAVHEANAILDSALERLSLADIAQDNFHEPT